MNSWVIFQCTLYLRAIIQLCLIRQWSPLFWLISCVIALHGFIIYSIVHFPIPLLLFVLSALKIHTQHFWRSFAMNREITSFVKVYEQLFSTVWIVKPLHLHLCCIALNQHMHHFIHAAACRQSGLYEDFKESFDHCFTYPSRCRSMHVRSTGNV